MADLDTLKWFQIDCNVSNCQVAMDLNITNINESTNSKIDTIKDTTL